MITKEMIEDIRRVSYKNGWPPSFNAAVDAVCNLALANLEGEEVWCVEAPSGWREHYLPTKEKADYAATLYEPGWTVRKFRLVPEGE